MNTIEKGDRFEDICHGIIESALQNGELGIDSKKSRLQKKPNYYSRDREKAIIFDLSIEVWMEGADRYSFLYLIECKDYSNNIPVDDIEEFSSKVQQVSGHNVKAVFIASKPLSSSARMIAKNRGIMVIEVSPNITYDIVLYKGGVRPKLFHKKQVSDAMLSVEKKIQTDLIYRFLLYLRNTLPYLPNGGISQYSKEDLKMLATAILENVYPSVAPCYFKPIASDLMQFVKERFQLEVKSVAEMKETIVAECDFKLKEIRISSSVWNTSRMPFIFCHELGHYFLHNKISINQWVYDSFPDPEYSFEEEKYLLKNPSNFIEWQANYFASCLLLPEQAFKFQLQNFRLEQGISIKQGKIFVDDQPVNRRDFRKTVTFLSNYFKTTKTSVIIKLSDLDLVQYGYSETHISNLITEFGT